MKPTDYLEVTEEEIQNLPVSILEVMEAVFLEHNEKIIRNLEGQLSSYYKDKKALFQELCNKYQMTVLEKDVDFILNSTFELNELEERLKMFQKLNIPIIKPFLFLFCSLDDIFLLFTEYIQLGVFSFSYLQANLESLLREDNLLKIKENYRLFQKLGFQCESLDSLLLMNPSDIMNQKEIADMYQLTNYDGIFEPYFFECLDIWIEYGIFDYFSKNQILSHLDFVTITKRIVIGLKLGLPIFDEEGKVTSQFLEERKFFLPNSSLDSYIANHVSIYLERFSEKLTDINLDIFLKDSLTYDFDGILISRPKVLRNVALHYPERIFHGSILNSLECEKIYDLLNQKKEEICCLTVSKKGFRPCALAHKPL